MRITAGPINLIFALLVALGAIVATWRFDFAYDDFWQIVRNQQVVADKPALEVSAAIILNPTAPGNLYRPIALLSYWLEYSLAGLNPAVFHLTNALLYALVCWLVLCLYQRLLRDREAALFGALIFAAHPLHVEVFANVVGRAEILAALFGLGALLLLLEDQRADSGGRPLLAALLCSGALLSKETAVGLIICLPFFLLSPEIGAARRRIALLAAALGMAIYLALRINVLGPAVFLGEASVLGPIPENPIGHMNFLHRLLPALAVLGSYIRLCFIPWPLSADYSLMPRDLILQIFSFYGVLSVVIFLLFGALALRFRPCRWGALGMLAIIGFLPSSNIFFPIGTLMAERLSFIPSIGYCGFIVGVVGAVLPSNRINRAVLILVATTYLCLSAARVPVWQDNSTLFRATAEDAPLSPKAAFNWGIELQKAGAFYAAENSFRRTLELNPKYIPAMRSLAEVLLVQGVPGRAEYWLRQILEIEPQDSAALQAVAALEKLKVAAPIAEKQKPASARSTPKQ
ncbi:MAG: glycosyltransferase family 39 protein [Oligoflexia bacterium]|nr:glycosyltransferase family 39 protein [Oligoflexia bacterium]